MPNPPYVYNGNLWSGSQWYNGTGVPNPIQGKNGDFFLRTDTDEVYTKVAGAWVVTQDLTGYTGSQGNLGFTGSQGFTGSTGFTGSASTVQGPQGFTGSFGSQGFTGSFGLRGFTGSTGFTGSASTVQGPIGYTGSVGFTGSTGFTGSASTVQGPQGSQGFTGSQGSSSISWTIVSSGIIMTSNIAYFVNTTSAPITMTLPAVASTGDTIRINDLAGTFATNNLTVARNGHLIQGVADDLVANTSQASFGLVYSNVTFGWKLFELI